MKIKKRMPGVCLTLLSCAVAAIAQAGVTTSGTTTVGTVPVFGPSSNATVTNSPIAISGSNVGIGTTASYPLEVAGPIQSDTNASGYNGFRVGGSPTDFINSAPVYGLGFSNTLLPSWTSGAGPVQISGYYGLTFYSLNQQTMTLDRGQVGIGTANPEAPLTVSKYLQNGLGTNESVNTVFWTGADVNLIVGGDLNGSSIPFLQSRNGGTANVIGESNYKLALNPYGGNVGIGTTNPGATLEVNGGLRFTNDPAGTAQTTAWTGVLCGGDYAESVGVSGTRKQYEPGDLIVVDPAHPGEFEKSSQPYSTLVAGVYSTKPGVIGKRSPASSTTPEIPMAMIGIVPAKVSAENGPVRPGDLLVTSSTLGYAMRGTDPSRMTGAVVGKALGSVPKGKGVVEVLVTLQ